MPEPDFYQIARACLDTSDSGARDGHILRVRAETEIAEQLRQVWNARGADDTKAVERCVRKHFGIHITSSEVQDAIKELDR